MEKVKCEIDYKATFDNILKPVDPSILKSARNTDTENKIDTILNVTDKLLNKIIESKKPKIYLGN